MLMQHFLKMLPAPLDQELLCRTMKLTAYTDYALRTLMYLGANRDRLVTIQDIAGLHNIAKNHLTKVVHQLGLLGVVQTVRGRNGGLRLGKEPADILIGDLVRNTETDFHMAECFDRERNSCILTPSCTLKGVLNNATRAYFGVLDGVTLQDLLPAGGDRAANTPSPQPIRIQRRKKVA